MQGLSQDELAFKADLGRSHYGRIERGEHSMSIDVWLKIARVLDLDIGILSTLKKTSSHK